MRMDGAPLAHDAHVPARPSSAYGRQPGLKIEAAIDLALAIIIFCTAILIAWQIFPENFAFVRMPWVLHPFEQEHLMIARNLADGHGLTFSGLPPEYGSEDKGYVAGEIVPRGPLLPYAIYAASFLVSDTAWLAVTPLFGIAAAMAVVALVHDQTTDFWSSMAALLAFACASPVLLATSGVAFESVIALAFLLWGAFFLQRAVQDNRAISWLASGALFGCCAASRVDYAPAALLYVLIIGIVCIWRSNKQLPFRGDAIGAIFIGSLLALSGVASILIANYAFTGDPLKSAYPANTWLSSADGVGRSLLMVETDEMFHQIKNFLWDIGRPTMPLLLGGLLLSLWTRRLPAGVVVLLGLSAFIFMLHMTKATSHLSDTPSINASLPRYLLPVYATAIVVGFTALHGTLKRLRYAEWRSAQGLILGLGMIVASVGVHEAYASTPSLRDLASALADRRAVHDFSAAHGDALFVSDYHAAGVIVTPRLLIPRLSSPDRVVELVGAEIDGGRRVFMVDLWQDKRGSRYYSGYVEYLSQAGFVFCPAIARGPRVTEILPNPLLNGDDAGTLYVAAESAEGTQTPILPAGTAYYIAASGSFAFDASGRIAGPDQLLVNDHATTGALSGTTFCTRVDGGNAPVRLRVADSVLEDNSGGLIARVIAAP